MRRRAYAGPCLALLLALVLAPAAAPRGENLVADLSEHLIAITTAFVGTTVVLFGTVESGGDIAVTVHGPRADDVVWRKARVAGIWVNRDQMVFRNVPEYYAVASSRPLASIADAEVRARHELGIDHLRLDPAAAADLDLGEITAFRDALIRNKQRELLYVAEPGIVRFVGPELFRTSIMFPANVPPGLYQVQVFELKDGMVTDAQRSTLVISKVGFEADLFDFALNQAPLYGLAAILIALASGWLAGVVFRRT